MSYQKRVCCFIDILGFKNHINETVDSADHFNIEKINSIKSVLSLLKELNNETNFSKSKQVTFFSDSIVISFRIDDDSEFPLILNELMLSNIELINKGYLIRGGIATGFLVHDHNFIFGPAMLKAYDLESNKAIFPRIIIDKNDLQQHSSLSELSSILSDDKDFYYIDYISKSNTFLDDPTNDIPKFLTQIKTIYEDNFNEKMSTIVKKKYLWLKKKVNHQIKIVQRNVKNNDCDSQIMELYKNIKPIV